MRRPGVRRQRTRGKASALAILSRRVIRLEQWFFPRWLWSPYLKFEVPNFIFRLPNPSVESSLVHIATLVAASRSSTSRSGPLLQCSKVKER
eukprot:scaffold3651_cov156-Amphora_coffeaeformis.AAC.4